MRHLPSLFAALALAGCNQPGASKAAVSPTAPAIVATTNAMIEPVPVGPDRAKPTAAADCGAAKAVKFIGQIATSPVRLDVAKAVGHLSIRWTGPGDAVTMDYSESRLNAELDAKGKIKGFRCG